MEWIVVTESPFKRYTGLMYIEGTRYADRLHLRQHREQATRMSEMQADRLANWLNITVGGGYRAEPA